MSDHTTIEWTDASWTPIRARVKADASALARARGYAALAPIAEKMAGRVGPHCERTSPGCQRCYSETNNARRLPYNGTGLPFDRRSRDLVDMFVDQAILEQPLHWTARRIFVCSQTDLFAPFVTDEMIDQVFTVMRRCEVSGRGHIFQALTKQPQRALDFVSQVPVPKNMWLGTSVEDQRRADERREPLRQIAALGYLTWVSYEPALGPVEWESWQFIDWLVSGGESGKDARPSHPDYHRAARDFCQRQAKPYLFKQWGEWTPCLNGGGHVESPREQCINGIWMLRVGKKDAGRLLDGQEWNEYPTRT